MGKVVFSSEMLPPGLSDQQRFLAWRDLYNQHVGKADLIASEAPFNARMEFVQTSDVLLGRVSVTLKQSEHGGRSRVQSTDEGRVGLLINASAGPIQCLHRKHEEFLAPGGSMLLSRVTRGGLFRRKTGRSGSSSTCRRWLSFVWRRGPRTSSAHSFAPTARRSG